ncbi:MAG: pitrilysin family protein [Pseudomonadota bacterium]
MRIFALILALFAAPLARGAEPSVTTFTLENGLQGVVIVDSRAPVVTHMVWYRVGSADEPPGKSGIAHFLEHLMFTGTDELSQGEFSRIIADNGGQDNAFTSYDFTGYFQRIGSERLELMMQLEADRMADLRLDPAVIQPERDVIIEERNQRVDNDPAALFGEERRAAQYLNHPYGRPIIGWRHEMERLTREDALAFYDLHYAPNNAILVVAGDVDPGEVEALAARHYGPLPPSDLPPRVRPSEPPQRSARRLEFIDPRVRQPYVIRSYLAPSRATGDQDTAAALQILASLLGGGITSHLQRTLTLDTETALDVGAFYSPLALDETTFGVYIVPQPGLSLVEAEAALDAAVQDFIDAGPDPERLARIKGQLRAAEIFALDSQRARAGRYGRALTMGLTVEDVADWPAALERVTVEDVAAAAEAVFDLRRSVTGYLMRTPEDREGSAG